jgi:hypothetical protein
MSGMRLRHPATPVDSSCAESALYLAVMWRLPGLVLDRRGSGIRLTRGSPAHHADTCYFGSSQSRRCITARYAVCAHHCVSSAGGLPPSHCLRSASLAIDNRCARRRRLSTAGNHARSSRWRISGCVNRPSCVRVAFDRAADRSAVAGALNRLIEPCFVLVRQLGGVGLELQFAVSSHGPSAQLVFRLVRPGTRAAALAQEARGARQGALGCLG